MDRISALGPLYVNIKPLWSYWPAGLGIDSWAPKKVYQFELWIAHMSWPLWTNLSQLSHLSEVSGLKASLCSLAGQYINSAELA
jgi:hypothetical protein